MIEQRAPDVGSQLRALRQKSGFSLRDLAERCDLSPNTISLIERGESSPSVSTLHRLATALDVQITAFFTEDMEHTELVLTRAAERRRSQNAQLLLESLGTGLEDQSLEPFLVTMQPEADSGPHAVTHRGQELVFCLAGEVEYAVAGQTYRLAAGDALLFEAKLPHRWHNPGPGPATFILVFGAAGRTQPIEQHLRS